MKNNINNDFYIYIGFALKSNYLVFVSSSSRKNIQATLVDENYTKQLEKQICDIVVQAYDKKGIQ